jgi:Rrf2 family transcriptional regulator, iron-sulfur cluster assembly transcription factor
VFSTTSDYALRAILVLARAYGVRRMRADEIADAIAAPRNYLGKTLNALAKAGLLTSTRGPQGGFALAVAPEALSVARVIDCFDEPVPQTRCLLGTAPCDRARPCAAHHRWTALTAARREPLATTTVADLLGVRAPAAPAASLPLPDGDVVTAAA